MASNIEQLSVGIKLDLSPYKQALAEMESITGTTADRISAQLERITKAGASLRSEFENLSKSLAGAGTIPRQALQGAQLGPKEEGRELIRRIEAYKRLYVNERSALGEIVIDSMSGFATGGPKGAGKSGAQSLAKEILVGIFDPDLEDYLRHQLDALERAEGDLARLYERRSIAKRAFEAEQAKNPAPSVEPDIDIIRIDKDIASAEENLNFARQRIRKLIDDIKADFNTLQGGGSLQQLSGVGVDALAELAAAAESLTGKLDPGLIDAMASVINNWPDFRDTALDNLKPIEEAVDRLNERLRKLPGAGSAGGAPGGGTFPPALEERALGGPVYPGVAFLVGERGPEIFVPDRAGRILPNSILASGSGGGLLGDDFDAVIAEIERFGEALDLALEGVPEEVERIVGTLGGSFIQSLEQGRGVMEALEVAGRKAAGQALHTLLQSEQVRGELGELADVIENVLNQALNGSIDSWEDLGRVALEVLQAIAEKMVEAQQLTMQTGGGNGGGIFGTILQLAGAAFGAFGGGSTVGGSFGAGNTTGAGGAGFSYLGYGGPRARGGPVMPNRAFLVGEMGPELFVPKVPGHVIANAALGGGGRITINNYFHAPGADSGALERVRDELRLQRLALQRLDGSVEPRAIAEVMRQADRGGSFARSVGRRPS